MPRPRKGEPTDLGRAARLRRGDQTLKAAATAAGVTETTLSRIERGAHRPSWDTAVALAAWLGWTPGQVMDAAATPAEPT